jgi:hypothetical protein
MSKINLLAGTVSHINQFSTTSGSVRRGEGRVRTRHQVSFRINNVPFTFPGMPNLGDGDYVTIVYQVGGLKASILRNDSTGVQYFNFGWIHFCRIMAYMLIFSCFFFIIPIVVGIWIIYSVGKQEKELKQTLLNNPPKVFKE